MTDLSYWISPADFSRAIALPNGSGKPVRALAISSTCLTDLAVQ